jgi:catechol 2,3-dioxygenase-like lactoylglutathione lyase family enzyme
MTFEITGIDHVVLNCSDVDAIAAWYERALDLEVEVYGEGRKALVFGAQKINLRPVGSADWETASVETPGGLDICFMTASPVSDVIERWQELGIEVHEGPIQRSGARGPITSVYALDPDGNLVEVAQY